ncbi:MAG TPA: hypothetical protein VJ873_09110, partial [bacterium]|nr:hypothetical protein [bacterium]
MKFPIFCFLLWFPSLLFALPLTDARNLSLGGLALASAPVESSLFLNPALLGGSEGLRTTYSQVRLSPDDFDFELSGAFPLIKGRIGLGLGWDAQISLNQQQTGIVRDSNGQVIVDPSTGLPLTQVLGFFTQSDNVFYLSGGANLGFCSLGASLKYYLQDFGNVEGQGWGLDFSGQVPLADGLALGAAFLDATSTTLIYNQGQPSLVYPQTLIGGLAWDFLKLGEFSFQMDPAVSMPVGNPQSLQWAAGLESSWLKSIFVRVGGNQNQLGFGVGLVAHPQKVFSEIKVDYTYLTRTPDGYPSR